MTTQADCKGCRWFAPLGLRHADTGLCRRYAPRPDRSRDDDDGEYLPHHADWPRVEQDDWCGEYSANPAPTPPADERTAAGSTSET